MSINWAEEIRAEREKRQARRREIGDEAYLRENGYDPARFWISHGMILRRMNAKSKTDNPTGAVK